MKYVSRVHDRKKKVQKSVKKENFHELKRNCCHCDGEDEEHLKMINCDTVNRRRMIPSFLREAYIFTSIMNKR